VAVVATAQRPQLHRDHQDDIEMVMDVTQTALTGASLEPSQVGFTVSGSADYLTGVGFSFLWVLDALGAVPPIQESHVEMDAAWAFYEAVARLQEGDIDTALVFGFGKSSLGDLPHIMSLQLDPYYLAPLALDAISLAGLQANALVSRTATEERDLAEVVARSRHNAASNEYAQLQGDVDVDSLLGEPYVAFPLRKHDCPPITDGAAALVLAAGDRARELCERPAWVRGLDQRIDTHRLGQRDLTSSPSTVAAAKAAGVHDGKVDVAEVHAPFSHQELILRQALGLDDDVDVNPSGGALCGNPMMSAGLIRIIEVARRISTGAADRGIAHATSGPCLQHNLVAVLEGN
jgi:acetyl-CoA acetyltransferase